MAQTTVTVIDYGAGNVRSLVNAVKYLGYEIRFAETANDIETASRLIFPGVGAFGSAIEGLNRKAGIREALKKYLEANKPYLGICIGLQALFASSDESPGTAGLGLIPSAIKRFEFEGKYAHLAVPHMGWNELGVGKSKYKSLKSCTDTEREAATCRYYFVHSYAAFVEDFLSDEWIQATTRYGNREFVSVVSRGNIWATQFHPEKSAWAGLQLIQRFIEGKSLLEIGGIGKIEAREETVTGETILRAPRGELSLRVIACLDVRTNDEGDLVVTKGDQYDVREREKAGEQNRVRNLGKPVDLAARYYEEGADEIAFLNITGFRECPIEDEPTLEVLRRASQKVFVPLTVGGGIRDLQAIIKEGKEVRRQYSAVQIAAQYFASGADKVSIGSDAVSAAQNFIASERKKTGKTSIEMIAKAYGNQAVVISVDPRRVYVDGPYLEGKHVIATSQRGPNGQSFCWYRCTVSGGRKNTDLDVWDFVKACEELGAGEILLNCIDQDGTKNGYDIELISEVKKAVKIPVIASSGAGCVEHFSQVFQIAQPDAVLAAGIFHRREVSIESVKKHLHEKGIPVRRHLKWQQQDDGYF